MITSSSTTITTISPSSTRPSGAFTVPNISDSSAGCITSPQFSPTNATIKIASSKTSKVRIDINDSCDALDANQYTSRPTWRGHGISIRPRGAASARLSMMKQAAREGRVFVVRYIHDSNRRDGDRQDHDTATAGYGALRASLANADAIAVGAASPRCGARPAPAGARDRKS